MKELIGKPVADKLAQTFEERIKKLKIKPNIAVLGIKGDNASEVYLNKIQKNCNKYDINCNIYLEANEEDFIKTFSKIKDDKTITGVMFAEPLPKQLAKLINEIEPNKDIEGINVQNKGKLFIGENDVLIPCTSRAVIEILDYYNINLTGKKVVIMGRSNIVGKPLIPQLLNKNATITVCHSKTENIEKELIQADVVIMAIGQAEFLKAEHIKKDAIIIDVGINFKNGKMVGDVDFETIKDKVLACTPVPGGVGVVTNMVLIDNIIKACEI